MTTSRNPVRLWLRGLPLQRRVAYLTTVAVALAVAATSLAGYVTLRVSLYDALDTELVGTATSLAVSVAPEIQRLNGLTESALQAGNVSIAAYRADGKRYFVPDEREHLVLGADELQIARIQRGYSARSGVSTSGEPFRIVAVPITQLAGRYSLVLGRPLGATDDILSSLWLVSIIFGSTGVVGAALAGASVARSSLRPVRELTTAAEHVTETEQLDSIRIDASGDLAMLAQSFNRMLRSLNSSRQRQTQLIADAGHELRTPLTSLRTNIELLAADARSGMLSEPDRVEILGDVTAQLAEFTSLIGDLVQLARDETAAQPETLDFRDVVHAALDRARRRRHGMVFDVELDPFYVVGDSDMLERAITNLLDNAVKWSPPGGTIRVQLEGDRLRIADEGPGISDADLPHVFDRFYRADSARNTPGTGLGLSIVAQAINQHGGSVQASRSAQGGAEFTVQLPGSAQLEALQPA